MTGSLLVGGLTPDRQRIESRTTAPISGRLLQLELLHDVMDRHACCPVRPSVRYH